MCLGTPHVTIERTLGTQHRPKASTPSQGAPTPCWCGTLGRKSQQGGPFPRAQLCLPEVPI